MFKVADWWSRDFEFNDVDKENDDDVDFEVQGSLCKYLLIEGLNFVAA